MATVNPAAATEGFNPAAVTAAAAKAAKPGPVIESVQHLELGMLMPNPNQPRKYIGEEELTGLASSIRKEGVIQPIVVTPLLTAETVEIFVPTDKLPEGKTHANYIGKHLIIAGQRRWAASALAQKKVIPSLVREIKAEDLLVLSATENLTRTDMTVLEEATVYKYHTDLGWTADRVATQYGKHRTHVANFLGLLELPKPIVDALGMSEAQCEKEKVYQVHMGHARWIKGLKGHDDVQLALLKRVQEDGVSVKWIEEQVKEAQARIRKNEAPEEIVETVEQAPKTTAAAEPTAAVTGTAEGVTPAEGATATEPAVEIKVSDEIVAAVKAAKMSLKTGVKYVPGEPEAQLIIQVFGMNDLARLMKVFGVAADVADAVLTS